MKLKLSKSTTNKILRVFIQDTTQTDGRGLTGLTNASSGLSCYYIREGDSTSTAVTLASATVGTWTSGGFVACDATNLAGLYEFGVPNAAFASGNSVVLMLKGAANMAPVPIELELDSVNYQDGVRFGVTALPNAAASAANGLLTFGTGTGQINAASGNAPATVAGDVGGKVLGGGASSFIANGAQVSASVSGSVTVGAYATGQSPKEQVLGSTSAIALLTDASGKVLLQPSQAFSNATASTVAPTWYTAPGGAVASVTGDVGGKVLGNGASAFIANGVQTAAGSTPPTVAQIRQEMDANSTKLVNLDATVSSRSTYAGGAVASVTGNVGGDVTGKVLGGGSSTFISNGAQVAASGGGGSVTVAAYATGLSPREQVLGSTSAVSLVTDSAGKVALTAAEEQAIALAVLTLANGVEPGENLQQFFRELRAVMFGISNENAGTVTFARKDGVTIALTATHSATGSRTSITTGTV